MSDFSVPAVLLRPKEAKSEVINQKLNQTELFKVDSTSESFELKRRGKRN